jgi:hypothetical protein
MSIARGDLNNNHTIFLAGLHVAKSVSLVAASLLLIAGLIFGSVSIPNVFAYPPDPCFGGGCMESKCTNDPEHLEATCCWMVSYFGGIHVEALCQTCNIDTDTGDFVFCSKPESVLKGNPSSGTTPPQPPTNLAPPKVCPDGSSPDANGKCPPTTQAPTDQGTTLPPPEKHKGSNLGQLGGSLLNNNKSPSSQTTDNTSPKHHKDDNNALQVPPIDQGPS